MLAVSLLQTNDLRSDELPLTVLFTDLSNCYEWIEPIGEKRRNRAWSKRRKGKSPFRPPAHSLNSVGRHVLSTVALAFGAWPMSQNALPTTMMIDDSYGRGAGVWRGLADG
jgi:hypothetical protein